jgi:hypothetical protein
MRKYLLPLASLLLVVPAVYAGTESAAIDAQAAFDRLRKLAGEWEAKTDQGGIRVTYEVIAGGSAVVERQMPENMPAMLTVYYLDGSRLLLTHYCMLGNQPRMEAKAFNPETGELKFEFLDITNLAPGAVHMHNGTFRFVDANHLTGEWQFFEAGKLKMTQGAQFTRVHPAQSSGAGGSSVQP